MSAVAVDFQDTLKAELVLVGIELLGDSDRLNDFAVSARTDVDLAIPGPLLAPGDLGIAQMIRLPRERIIVQTSAARSFIRRDYPIGQQDLDRLAEVANEAIVHTDLDADDQTLRAFGFNVDIVYDQSSGMTATQYLAERLFHPDLFASSGLSIVGGGGRITLQSSEGFQWGVSVEPRHNDPNMSRVFLSVNLHREEQVMPSAEDIRYSLSSALNQAHRFAHILDGEE